MTRNLRLYGLMLIPFLMLPTLAEAEVFTPPKVMQVSADPHGSYQMLEREIIGRDVIRVMIRRESATTGVRFTVREIDCPKDVVRLIGDGGDAEAARQRLPNSDAWSVLFARSINWHVMREACAAS